MKLSLRHGLISLLCIALLSFVYIRHNISNGHATILAKALEASGATISELSIYSWTKISPKCYTKDGMMAMVIETANELGIPQEQLELNENNLTGQVWIRAAAINNEKHITVSAKEITSKSNASREAYLAISIESQAGNVDELYKYQQLVSNIIGKYNGVPHNTTCLVGWLDGKLENGKWGSCVEQAFRAISATTSDQVITDNFASFTGYTSAITESLDIGSQRTNVNMAFRYSPYDDRTYITIGAPIITKEY